MSDPERDRAAARRGTTKWWRGRLAFILSSYGTTISLIMRVAEDVDPYNANELFPPTEPSAHELSFPPRNGGFINFFFPKKKKLQKEVGERAARPPCRTIYRQRKMVTSPHARPFGSNGVPQRDCKSPQSQIFPHEVRTENSKFQHPTEPSAHKIHFPL